MKVGRNDPCPCGSKKKYKQCCLAKASKPKGALQTRAKVLQSNALKESSELGSKPRTQIPEPRPLKAVWINQPAKPVQTVNLIERAFGDSIAASGEVTQPETPLEEPTVETDDVENT